MIFIPRWEYQCCGEPLRVGDVLPLRLNPMPPDRVWARRLPAPPEWVGTHHGPAAPGDRLIRAHVYRIWEAFADEEVVGGRIRLAPSSGSLRPILVINPNRDTWEGDPDWDRPGLPPGRRRPRAAHGWVLLVDVLAELNPAVQ
ncbi:MULTISPECIES: DUF6578 domain-containing protein [unclassified Luteococcus]|uniref:DUF6578 domain-containing protein n=1 Tax=unclassified Luteococcus TaxID=2639923 RepID=UPI00313E4680